MKILFGMKKGGCGKTTTATQLAAMYAAAGKKTLLVDTDENQSAMQFRQNRPETAAPFQAVGITTPSVKTDLDAFDHDVIIIDSGGRDSKVFRAALLASDFFVLPVQASEYDIRLLEETLEVLKECRDIKPIKAAILRTMVIPNPRVKITGEAEVILDEIAADYNVKIFKTKILMREPYIRTAERGMSVTEIWAEEKGKKFLERSAKYEKPAEEMEAFYKELNSLIKNK
ncbi:MAG TPA: ParA family protein [bacterium]|nr:ParA family protein [bacterium]